MVPKNIKYGPNWQYWLFLHVLLQKLKKILSIAALVFFAAQFVSCKKDTRVLGQEAQPANDVLNGSFDNSAPVYVHTIFNDSVRTYSETDKFLGVNNDPHFGTTDVGLYLNNSISVSDLSFPSGAEVQEAELILAIDPFNSCGNLSSLLSYSVYTLDSVLISNRQFYTSNTRLHSAQGLNKVSAQTYTVYNGVQVLRIPVDLAYANTIIKNPQYTVNNETFQSRYKGFYIKCATQPGAEGVIYRCLVADGQSGFYVRYKNGTTTEEFRFPFTGTGTARFNTVKYNYSNANPLLKTQIQGDTLGGKQTVFLKGFGQLRTRIHMPSLKSYADSFKVAVNRAELVVNVDPTFTVASGTQYNKPLLLSLLAADSLGLESFTADQLNSVDLARYDGGYDSQNNRYVFNIARHVQAVLSGKIKNYGFYLVVATPSPLLTRFRDYTVDRVALCGSDRGALRPTFSLSYVKFPKD